MIPDLIKKVALLTSSNVTGSGGSLVSVGAGVSNPELRKHALPASRGSWVRTRRALEKVEDIIENTFDCLMWGLEFYDEGRSVNHRSINFLQQQHQKKKSE